MIILLYFSVGAILIMEQIRHWEILLSILINNFHADICFMSCRGLDRFGSYEANYNQALLKQQMIANADLTVLLADSSKFNTSHYLN